MIWPWSRIRELENALERAAEREAYLDKWHHIYEKLYIQRTQDLRAAHKGIRRLVEKVKRLEEKGTGDDQ